MLALAAACAREGDGGGPVGSATVGGPWGPASAAEASRDLVAGYRDAFPLPADPRPALEGVTPERAQASARERELLALARSAPDDAEGIGGAALARELGWTYSQVREHRLGMAWLLRALDGLPEDPVVWLGLGANRLSAGEVESALALLAHAEALDAAQARHDRRAQDPRAARYQGDAWLLLGETDRALDAYERALRAAPEYHDAALALAGLLVDLGRGDDAQPRLERLLAIEPDLPPALFLLARIADERGETERADELRRLHERAARVEALGLVAQGAPQVVRHARLGLLHLDEGRPELARVELREALRLQPQPPLLGEVLAGLVEALLRLDLLDEAAVALARLEQQVPGSPHLPTLRARAREKGL